MRGMKLFRNNFRTQWLVFMGPAYPIGVRDQK